MMIFKFLLLLLYAASDYVYGLPITSTPLENNPDHLAWDAPPDARYLTDHEQVRKIPKSIFITPNLNDSNKTCQPGYKLDKDGKCYKTNHFNYDPLEILKAQIESLVNANNKDKPSTGNDYEEYDYDAYDATDSNEPYHVPLSLSFAADEQISGGGGGNGKKPNDDLQNLPFRGEETVGNNVNSGSTAAAAAINNKPQQQQQQFFLGDSSSNSNADAVDKTWTTETRTDGSTTTSKSQGTKNSPATESIIQNGSNIGSLHGKGTYQFFALSAINDAKTETGGTNIDSSKPIATTTTTTESPFDVMTMTNGIVASHNKHSEKLMEMFKPYDEKIAADESAVTTTLLQNDVSTEIIDADDNDATTLDNINNNSNDDEKKFQIELQGESLFEDDSSNSSNINSSTIIIENDGNNDIQTTIINDDATTEYIEQQQQQKQSIALHDISAIAAAAAFHNKNDAIKLTATTTTTTSKPKNKMHLEIPTTTTKKNEQVQIVTPEQNNDSATTNPPLSTSFLTIHDNALSSSTITNTMTTNSNHNTNKGGGVLLNIENDSDINNKLRESIIKHELNEDAIETIDQHNRFIYNHLETSSQKIPTAIVPATTTTTTTTVIPPTPQPTSSLRNLLEQLRLISKYTESNQKHHNDRNKVKFPESNQSSPTPPQSSQYQINMHQQQQQQYTRGGGNSNPSDHQRVVKFPGPVSQRNPVSNRNDLIPVQQMSKKPPDPQPPEKPTYSWPPRGWTFDRSPAAGASNARPVLMRFWNKMPLIRDPSFSDVSERTRENSKSPTDSLFEEVPVSDVYKVLSSKNYRHNNR